jgi:hypothetical protein
MRELQIFVSKIKSLKTYFIIAEQATLAPAFPVGCVTKSSALS